MKSILDPSFRYTPSSKTDLRKTFARIRREMRTIDPARSPSADAGDNVVVMRHRSPASAR